LLPAFVDGVCQVPPWSAAFTACKIPATSGPSTILLPPLAKARANAVMLFYADGVSNAHGSARIETPRCPVRCCAASPSGSPYWGHMIHVDYDRRTGPF
jgi:hypothetical protein